MWVSSAVTWRLAKPMRRVVRHLAPTPGVPAESRWPSITPFCHSGKRAGSVA